MLAAKTEIIIVIQQGGIHKELIAELMIPSQGSGFISPGNIDIEGALAVAEGEDGDPTCEDFKRVFINPIIFEESGTEWSCEEGCLSIPRIREEVKRKPKLKIEYYGLHNHYTELI